jgi:hypothetical protein
MTRKGRRRRGVLPLEVAMTLAVGIMVALIAYFLGVVCCGGLYRVIASLIGSPYL